jgi:hypothetical protein
MGGCTADMSEDSENDLTTDEGNTAEISQALTFYCKQVTAQNLTVYSQSTGYNGIYRPRP